MVVAGEGWNTAIIRSRTIIHALIVRDIRTLKFQVQLFWMNGVTD